VHIQLFSSRIAGTCIVMLCVKLAFETIAGNIGVAVI
jgi:hypothetical protein